MTSYETLYKGSDNILMPKYFSSDYSAGVNSLGISTDPRMATQLNELNLKMNPGTRFMEVGAISQDVMDSIPREHLSEIRRLAKNTGVDLSFHAPILEPTGIGQRGGWEEINRIGVEKQITSTLERAHELNPKGNINVTFHSTAQLPELETKFKEGKEETKTGVMIINPESGEISQLKYRERYFPEEGEQPGKFKGEPIKINFDEELTKRNKDVWEENLDQATRIASFGMEPIEQIKKKFNLTPEVYSQLIKGDIPYDQVKDEEDIKTLKEAQRAVTQGQIHLKNSYRVIQQLFNTAYKSSDEEDKNKLEKFRYEILNEIKPGIQENPEALSKVIDKGLNVLNSIKTPKIFEPLQKFAIDQAAKTFGNAATESWKKFHETAPVLSIENPPAGSGLSRAEDLKELIEKSRGIVVKNLTEKEGLSKSEAEDAAKKLIGATWDVGHINMIRKMGYSEEDVIKESKTIAPFVKHVHLSDNFGLEHTELPMGMGNVPLKEIMKKLGEKGFEGKKIIEAGNWWQYFAEKGGGNPFKPSIEGMNSPIYTMGPSAYWSQPPAFGAYYSGHGPINTATHHRLYGAGFENLPLELGGEIPGERGRFSGSPNQ